MCESEKAINRYWHGSVSLARNWNLNSSIYPCHLPHGTHFGLFVTTHHSEFRNTWYLPIWLWDNFIMWFVNASSCNRKRPYFSFVPIASPQMRLSCRQSMKNKRMKMVFFTFNTQEKVHLVQNSRTLILALSLSVFQCLRMCMTEVRATEIWVVFVCARNSRK